MRVPGLAELERQARERLDRAAYDYFAGGADDELTLAANLVRRAAASGYRALVLTADVPVPGNRERDKRNQFQLPPGMGLANLVSPEGGSTWSTSRGTS